MRILYCLVPILILIGISYAFFFNTKSVDVSKLSKSIYDYSATSIDGDSISLSEYKNKKILIVNLASKCGYTYQYEDLQKLHQEYGDKIAVLGFTNTYK